MSAPSYLGRPMGADGEQTRRRIKAAVMKHVAEVGYANATMKAIAREAQLTSAAIYHYFPSKESLVVATLESVQDEIVGRLQDAAGRATTLVGRLTAILEEALACVEDYPTVTRFEASISFETSRHPDLSALRTNRRDAEEELYTQLISSAIAAGELAPDVDSQSLVDVILSISSGLTYLSATSIPERHRRAVRAVEAILASGLPVVGK
ncbi:TetR/AcrR family transcriptional regulator [Nocardia jiangxiensis]|uniref:TetR/AcrR family transcriptional regulator n=1 Tax=Nocardia jiangxiensis TaxID=282685 RepID=A0ABW6SAG6_9NOCA|nr:TetR/AcrR family transcriptional regulator [Nocardia jiangxiensis]